MDIWSKEKRSEVMSRIGSRDTKPELLVRRFLWSRGYRYRKNVAALPGTPDVVLKKHRVAIFVHGCFWHGHAHRRKPVEQNAEFWREKIERNQARDRRVRRELKDMGWHVITIWECQLTPRRRERTLAQLELALNSLFLSRFANPSPRPTSLPAPRRPAAYLQPHEEQSLAAEPSAPYGEQH